MKQTEIEFIGIKIKNAIVLWIVLSVLAGCILGVMLFSMQKEADYSTVHQEIAALADTIRDQYKKRPDYWGLNTQKVIEEKAAPENLLRQGQLVSSLGRAIVVGSDSNGSTVMPMGRQFVLSIDNISKQVCVALAHQSEEIIKNPALQMISISNENESFDFAWSGDFLLKDLSDSASRICSNKNKMSWSFE